METVLSSATRELRIGGENPFCIIGERINPTGRKIFQEQLRRGDLSRLETDVAEQVSGGAMMLDINMGTPLAVLMLAMFAAGVTAAYHYGLLGFAAQDILDSLHNIAHL